ncbi:unnamed protein product, partial [Laminaria digitata]
QKSITLGVTVRFVRRQSHRFRPRQTAHFELSASVMIGVVMVRVRVKVKSFVGNRANPNGKQVTTNRTFRQKRHPSATFPSAVFVSSVYRSSSTIGSPCCLLFCAGPKRAAYKSPFKPPSAA